MDKEIPTIDEFRELLGMAADETLDSVIGKAETLIDTKEPFEDE